MLGPCSEGSSRLIMPLVPRVPAVFLCVCVISGALNGFIYVVRKSAQVFGGGAKQTGAVPMVVWLRCMGKGQRMRAMG